MYIKIGLILLLAILLFYAIQKMFARPWKKPVGTIPAKWKVLLKQEVPFYRKLNKKDRELFHYKILEFTQNCKIIGVETTISDLDKVLVAACAIIPIFAFPEWKYKNLEEVLIYSDTVNLDFKSNVALILSDVT